MRYGSSIQSPSGTPDKKYLYELCPCLAKIEEIVLLYQNDKTFTFYKARREAKLLYWQGILKSMENWVKNICGNNYAFCFADEVGDQLKEAHKNVLGKMQPQQQHYVWAGGRIFGSHRTKDYIGAFKMELKLG
jgi:hypothetical protein